ncbi:transposase [Streptomyces sp. HNM0645]|uniref:transposase n=1 Tax=Streptomyces sp. HNM0645 TaxID=2782343 RepID=UPI0024B6ADA4|nr:transposase [Streptomyces sp. HNM0645]MDI9887185.1 transposase [Streptomyces sp. HNM0645]
MPAPRKYPDELRERAVREVRTTGRPIAHVAKDLGIHKEALGERGFFSTSEDYALPGDDVETRPLLPANPANLDGIGRRLHDIALSDGHHEVAHVLTHVFGHATCPDCETNFSVADQVSADWSATQ